MLSFLTRVALKQSKELNNHLFAKLEFSSPKDNLVKIQQMVLKIFKSYQWISIFISLNFCSRFSQWLPPPPLENAMALHLNKPEFSSPKLGYFVPSLVEIGPVVFSPFFLLFPIGKRHDPSIEQTWIPFTQECWMPSLVEISTVVLEKMKMWKVYQQTIDNRCSEHCLNLTFGELTNQ